MNAYVTGAVVQATVVQAKTILGVEAPSHNGVFRLIYVRLIDFPFCSKWKYGTFLEH